MDTINKLLKKQAPKTNSRRSNLGIAGDASPDGESMKANPLFVRWISSKEGNFIGVPEEWLEGPVGAMFQGGVKQSGSGIGGKLIEEIS
jgi:Ino eighty subunit 2